MGVKAYDLISDVAHKLHKEEDDVFLLAVLEQHNDSLCPPTCYAASLYDRYVNRGEIPEWLQDWLIEVMCSRWIPEIDNPNIVVFRKSKKGGKM